MTFLLWNAGRPMISRPLDALSNRPAMSVIGMVGAATSHLSPVSGAIAQEVIVVLAMLNAFAPLIVGIPRGKTPPVPRKQPEILTWK